MRNHDRIRQIIEQDIYRRMNQLGGTLYMHGIQGVDPCQDLVHEIHNELTSEQVDEGMEIMQWWLVSDHLGERLRDTGFMVMETVDGWFYARTHAGLSLEHDIDTMLYREEQSEKRQALPKGWIPQRLKDLGMTPYPDRYPNGDSHEDPLLDDVEPDRKADRLLAQDSDRILGDKGVSEDEC